MSEYNVAPFARLVDRFNSLPGIGHKSATRLAYHVLEMPEGEVEDFSSALLAARKTIRLCKYCCNLTDKEVCSICSDDKRDGSVICVVENPRDVTAIEKTQDIHVKYHILHGAISPIKRIDPDMLKIKELLARLSDGTVKEVIMATNATVEGEATAMYISKLIKPLGIKVTRIAHGIPIGGDIEYADEVTLSRALADRKEI